MNAYFYVSRNHDWKGKYKFGHTMTPETLLCSGHEQHSHPSEYVKIFQIVKNSEYIINYQEYDKIISIIGRNKKNIKKIENTYNINLKYLRRVITYDILLNIIGGSTEFVKNDDKSMLLLEKILNIEYPLLGLDTYELSKKEIENLNEINKKNISKNKKNISNLFFTNENILLKNKKKFEWMTRSYQTEIIKKGISKLKKNKKFYLELATGGGKSYIVYNILKSFEYDNIIIFSPRKIINIQNVKSKYLNILENKNITICDFSNKKEFEINIKKNGKKLIICCTQSHDKLLKKFLNLDNKNILENKNIVWFDEAHWGIENWNYRNEWFKQQYNIFTSASPDKIHIEEHQRIYGNLYSPIKVKKLITKGYLCDLEALIFCQEEEGFNVNTLNFMLNTFEINNNNFGFSFHNSVESANTLFLKHQIKFKNDETKIKPFLLVGESKYLNNEECKNISNILKFEEHEKSIGYVVQKYSMGYDFTRLDFVCITDPKLSPPDIIQSIGRGMRILKKSEIEIGYIKEKCKILLPVYLECDEKTKYERVKKVLEYLICDVELEHIELYKSSSKPDGKNGGEKTPVSKIDGVNNIMSKVYDILYHKWKLKTFVQHLQENEIYSINSYNSYYDLETTKTLKLPPYPHEFFKEFNWSDVNNMNKNNKYYTKSECIERIKDIVNEDKKRFNSLKYNKDKLQYLNKVDELIPNECLWKYYGGVKKDFYF
jgi:hypothetical protein